MLVLLPLLLSSSVVMSWAIHSPNELSYVDNQNDFGDERIPYYQAANRAASAKAPSRFSAAQNSAAQSAITQRLQKSHGQKAGAAAAARANTRLGTTDSGRTGFQHTLRMHMEHNNEQRVYNRVQDERNRQLAAAQHHSNLNAGHVAAGVSAPAGISDASAPPPPAGPSSQAQGAGETVVGPAHAFTELGIEFLI